MGIRANRLLTELNIGVATLGNLLKLLGYSEDQITLNTQIPNDIADLARTIFLKDKAALERTPYFKDNDYTKIFKHTAKKASVESVPDNLRLFKNEVFRNLKELSSPPPIVYSEEENFWISELILALPNNNITRIDTGAFEEALEYPLYSVLIGTNGVGKSMLMKEIVDFVLELHAHKNNFKDAKLSTNYKGRLMGIRYHIDGVDCVVYRLGKSFCVIIDGYIQPIQDLRLPSIVACHFGAFDKLPVQKVNGSMQSKYDVPYYKYVGAHVNGNMISSSAIAFRLLFSLSEQMDDRQRQNICSILNFIKYDHRVSLSYTLVMKSLKDGAVKEDIKKKVDDDKEYGTRNRQEKNEVVNKLYTFYKNKRSASKITYDYDVDFSSFPKSGGSVEELQYIYKLKKYGLISSVNVLFFKDGCEILSDDLSSGEFAMLATILSISAAAKEPHTLVLLDEPELSLHPNWQMTLIDNLDRALANQVCHLLIATHSHLLVSDLPMKRSAVTQMEKDKNGCVNATTIAESTYGWSAEEVLLKVFKTATDRNKYLAEVVGTLLKDIGENTISKEDVRKQVGFLKSVSDNLSDVDPMKKIIITIIEGFTGK